MLSGIHFVINDYQHLIYTKPHNHVFKDMLLNFEYLNEGTTHPEMKRVSYQAHSNRITSQFIKSLRGRVPVNMFPGLELWKTRLSDIYLII